VSIVGTNLDLAEFTLTCDFSGAIPDTVTIVSDTEVTLTFNLGVPLGYSPELTYTKETYEYYASEEFDSGTILTYSSSTSDL
jgi:hypothetical protein